MGADYWGSPVEHAALQILEKSIEAVGVDRKAVLKYVKSRTFDTIIGEVDVRKQAIPFYWTVGQWQNGFFEAVKGVGTSTAALRIGGYGGPTGSYQDWTEEWDGTSWTAGGALGGARGSCAVFGILTAAVATGGYSPG